MNTQTMRAVVITAVVCLCLMPIIYMMLEGMWVDVIVAILGVAGFVLTWEVTRPVDEDDT